VEKKVAMESLHAVLAAHRDEVFLRWKALVQGRVAPADMSSIELLDHLPMFLRDVVVALREDAGVSSIASLQDTTQSAAEHGEQRLRLGFSLDAVVREYDERSPASIAIIAEASAGDSR
jgi:hypothetical protein